MTESKRYTITPQMREYDRCSRNQKWLPYLMYFHQPNYCSNVLNTGSKGFRLTTTGGRKTDRIENPSTSLFVGGSTAFGVGSTSDETTIPSLISQESNTNWLNFGGRAFSSTQELLLFMFFQHHFNQIDNVVVFSGLNNLFLYFLSKTYSEDLGTHYFHSQYNDAMQSRVLPASFARQTVVSVLKRLYPDIDDWDNMIKSDFWDLVLRRKRFSQRSHNATNNELWDGNALFHRVGDHQGDKDELLSVLRRDIRYWKIFSDAGQFKVYYILQPVATWTGKKLSCEEIELFEELDGMQQPNMQILKENFDDKQYRWYAPRIRGICEDSGVSFFDMNELFRSSEIDHKWLFVDRAHLTDQGYRLASELIRDKVLK